MATKTKKTNNKQSTKVKKDDLLKKINKTSKKTASEPKKKEMKVTDVKRKPKSQENKVTKKVVKTEPKKVTSAKKTKVTTEKPKKVTNAKKTTKTEVKKTTQKVKSAKKSTTKEKTTKSKKETAKIKVTDVIRKNKKEEKVIQDDELKTSINLPIITDVELKKHKETKLKNYDIGKTKKKHTKLKITLLSICKVFLLLIGIIISFFKKLVITLKKLLNRFKKIIKNAIIKFRNNKENRKVKNTPKEEEKTLIKEEIISKHHKKLTKQEKKNILNEDSYPSLLRYRDHKGFAWITVFFINRIKVIRFDMKRFGKKFKYGTFKDKLLILFMLMLIFGFSCIIAFCAFIVINAPEISEQRLYKNNSTTLLDKNGVQFARLGTENREKVYYDELPEVLVDAIVSAEDSRYFQHNGIDIARFSKAVIGQLMGNANAGGGSTLTMQVSKNAATDTTASGIKGLIRKFTDIYLSVFVFEKKFTKEQILEFYINIPYLGAGTYGVQQACKAYFGKTVSEINLAEAALIAGLFQAPDSYDPFQHPVAATNRRDTILNLMYRHGYISESERDAAKSIPISSMLIEKKSSANKYQDFIDTVITHVIQETGMDPTLVSMKIYTTMDPKKQDVVNGIISGETYTWKNEKAQAGIAVIDVKSGALAAVGASRDPGQRVMNRALEARRHPGSTAKPVLDYGPAIEYLGWGTGTTVIDNKYTYSSKGQIKNFDNGYKGVMTVKTALAQSRNIPALYTFQQTTNEQKLEFATGLGWRPETNISGENIKAKTPKDIKGGLLETDSIGGFNGVTPLESAAAFATFARGGYYIEPYSFTKIEFADETIETLEIKPNPVKVMEDSTAFMINMILKYAVTSGSVGAGSVSGTDLCAKTGTSTVDSAAKKRAGITGNLIGDSWEVAYSPDYAISTWYGYDTLNKDYYLTGGEGGTARKTITKLLTSGIMEKNSRFEKPSSVTSVEVELGTDPIQLPSAHTPTNLRSVEYFKKGTEPTEVSSRFDTLPNPSGLKYTATDYSVTLSWKPTPTPDAINVDKLKSYFEGNIYKKWADIYLNERIDYNNSTLGQFGYEIYMTNAAGTVDLGFTTSTTFSANIQFDSTTTFTVKSAYQYFKSNQSPGIQVSVKANSTNIDPNEEQTTGPVNLSIEYIGPECTTVQTFNGLGPNPQDKIRVLALPGRTDVTSKSTISMTACYDANSNEIACNTMTDGNKYTVRFTVRYGTKVQNKNVTISPVC